MWTEHEQQPPDEFPEKVLLNMKDRKGKSDYVRTPPKSLEE